MSQFHVQTYHMNSGSKHEEETGTEVDDQHLDTLNKAWLDSFGFVNLNVNQSV